MSSIIVAMPKLEDAKKISVMLKSRGISKIDICTTGASILSRVHELDSGIIICTRRFKDMYCKEIAENLPEYFEMLLVTSKDTMEHCPENVTIIEIPIRISELLQSIEVISMNLERRIRKNRSKSKKRSREDQEYIDKAKKLLMEKNQMTEQEAFRYIQKSSMDSCTNMVETAQMILLLQAD